ATSHKEISCLLEDREGNLWVGSNGGGLNRIRRRAIELEGTETGLPFAAVQSICQDQDGTIWVATQNGLLARRVNSQWKALAVADGWPEDATCVATDSQSGLWIGTRLHGLHYWRGDRFVDWGNPRDLRGQTLHTLLATRTGDLWLGEEGPHAIQHLKAGKLQTFDLPQ